MYDMKNPDAEAAAAWVASKKGRSPSSPPIAIIFGPSSFNGKKSFIGEGDGADADLEDADEEMPHTGSADYLEKVADEVINQGIY